MSTSTQPRQARPSISIQIIAILLWGCTEEAYGVVPTQGSNRCLGYVVANENFHVQEVQLDQDVECLYSMWWWWEQAPFRSMEWQFPSKWLPEEVEVMSSNPSEGNGSGRKLGLAWNVNFTLARPIYVSTVSTKNNNVVKIKKCIAKTSEQDILTLFVTHCPAWNDCSRETGPRRLVVEAYISSACCTFSKDDDTWGHCSFHSLR